MDIKRNCITCEFNFNGTCANEYYGMLVSDLEPHKNKDCWSLGLDYYSELVDKAPKNLQEKILYDDRYSINQFIKDIEKL